MQSGPFADPDHLRKLYKVVGKGFSMDTYLMWFGPVDTRAAEVGFAEFDDRSRPPPPEVVEGFFGRNIWSGIRASLRSHEDMDKPPGTRWEYRDLLQASKDGRFSNLA